MSLRTAGIALIAFLALGCPDEGPQEDDDVALQDDDATGDDDAGDDDATVADCDEIEPLDVGIYHRETADACPAEREPLNPPPSSCGSMEEDECTAHEDCAFGPNGRCVVADESGRCGCWYDECLEDSDCSATTLCVCAEQHPFELNSNNTCINAECHTDADCDTGLCFGEPFFCGAAAPGETMYITRFACASENDQCRNHETCYCDGSERRCLPDDDGAWVCSVDYMAACE